MFVPGGIVDSLIRDELCNFDKSYLLRKTGRFLVVYFNEKPSSTSLVVEIPSPPTIVGCQKYDEG
jgi:hypothetical protein